MFFNHYYVSICLKINYFLVICVKIGKIRNKGNYAIGARMEKSLVKIGYLRK